MTSNVRSCHAIRSKAPLRISFAGGGTDVSPYLERYGSAVLNATIDRYAHVSLDLSCADSIEIVSLDYAVTLRYDIDRVLAFDGQLDLIKGVLNHFRDQYGLHSGFRMFLSNDAPPGSGLGSSSAMSVACVKALAELLRLPLGPGDIAQLAWQIERQEVGLVGGKQDQWAAAYGGFNLLEFNKKESVVTPLRIRRDIQNELESSIVLGYAGTTRDSGHVIGQQSANITSSADGTIEALDQMKHYAYAAKDALVQGNLREFAEILDAEWQAKKRVATSITNPDIDAMYDTAISAGAWGGKISGAGGGGFMVFACDPDVRPSVMAALSARSIQLIPCGFSDQGAEAWRV